MRGNTITDRTGIKNPNYKHGFKHTILYRIYHNIKSRCYNQKSEQYNYYGNKGIKMCNEWLDDYTNFHIWAINNGYSDDLTIDRIDNNKDYESSNCRWVSYKIQARNRTNNLIFEIDGISKPLASWCEEFNINYKTVKDRLKRGWDINTSLCTPVQIKYRRK